MQRTRWKSVGRRLAIGQGIVHVEQKARSRATGPAKSNASASDPGAGPQGKVNLTLAPPCVFAFWAAELACKDWLPSHLHPSFSSTPVQSCSLMSLILMSVRSSGVTVRRDGWQLAPGNSFHFFSHASLQWCAVVPNHGSHGLQLSRPLAVDRCRE